MTIVMQDESLFQNLGVQFEFAFRNENALGYRWVISKSYVSQIVTKYDFLKWENAIQRGTLHVLLKFC